MTNNKFEQFNTEQQEIAKIAKVLSHPARIAIIQLLAEKKKLKPATYRIFYPLTEQPFRNILGNL
ncbi:MAG: hypothetical protein ACUVQP_10850 [Bacteroidales bacterium]